MRVLRRLSRRSMRRSAASQLRIRNVRFRKLLENTRGIIDLFDDGKEKLDGELIFDRQYVVSLVDKVNERIGMLVFDASVLAASEGLRLYTTYDECKRRSLSFLRSEPGLAVAEQGGSSREAEEEDEARRLLSEAVSWFLGPSSEGAALMEFVHQIFDAAVAGLDPFRQPPGPASILDVGPLRATNHIELSGPDPDSTASRKLTLPVRDVNCSPLTVLLMGAVDHGREGEPEREKRRWFALADYQHISLRRLDAGHQLLVEASLSGHTDADYIFAYAKHPLDLPMLLPEGFQVHRTEQGTMAWVYGVHGSLLEKSLVSLGLRLFGQGRNQGRGEA